MFCVSSFPPLLTTPLVSSRQPYLLVIIFILFYFLFQKELTSSVVIVMTGTSSPASVPHSSVVPSEVGWQFVPQYYTFVNKEPHRLHCFYNKNSTFIHGTEGEDGKPCYGQQVCP